jgi:cyclophilin family peptidyl-prolyl cis-trans isomerase/HEAT repeat protein
VTWEQKLTWIMRLEDQRILRDPNPSPRVILAPADRDRPAIVAPPPPSDLLRLLEDSEGRVRRRAALAAGRVGLSEAVEPLTKLLGDVEVEVRQMAAFSLGLIGGAAARPALIAALKDPDPLVQGRAAEALGLIGDRGDAPPVSTMVQGHVKAGVLATIAPGELGYPLAPAVEATRLGLYALARLGAYDSLAAAALDDAGNPVSRWWPVAYALQRTPDLRAARPLLALLSTPGRFTAAFSARGLGALKTAPGIAPPLREIVQQRSADPAVIIEAVRSLGLLGDAASAPALIKIVADASADLMLRLEALAALGNTGTGETGENVDLLLDLVSDRSAPIRAGAMRALARIDPETFLTTLSGLDPDRDWTVRVAQATALGTLPPERSMPRLLVMLKDPDQRVIPPVLSALVASTAPGVEQILLERLRADDFVIRSAAANGLAELKAGTSVPALVEAYRGSVGDSTYVARAAILSALNRIDPGSARPVLQEALKDREWAVRVRAASLLREQGMTDAVVQIRPATGGRPAEEGETATLLTPQFSPHAFVDTDHGTIEIELAISDAPLTVANFMALARRGFFAGVPIHRVVPDFVVQDGDPRGDGEGGPGYTIRDELNQRPYLRGAVGMALDWQDTGGSQFFITHSPQPHLDARYTVFGQVVNGMDVVDRAQFWDIIRRVRIWDGVTMSE